MEQLPILSFLIFLPIFATLIIAFLPKSYNNSIQIGLVASTINFLVSLKLITDFNKNIEEAAMDLGYNYTMVIYKVTLPIIFPSIIAGWLLAFTISLDDLVVASFTTGPGANTLPIVVFSKVRLGLSPEVNALSTILMLVLVLIGVVYFFLNNKLNVKK